MIFLGVAINVGSAWLTASPFSLAKTPLGWLIDHSALTLAIGGSLLALTALTGGVTAGHRTSSSSPSLTLEQQNRQRFLAKLQSRCTDLLAQSLQGAVQIALTFHSAPNAVRNMTRLRLRQAAHPEQDLPPGTSILDVYDQAGGDVLILGEPGVGKTTQLLNLAVALQERAALDEQHPLPVIINLSTWANHKRPLEEWLSEEAATSYDVPRDPLARWVRRDQVLPLLDGLDEVPEGARSACIDAINAFREAHLVPMVVCSRTDEYHTAASRSQLALQDAVVVQPLDAEQVDAYLKEGGNALAGIRSLLRKDADLRELVRTPLMLHVVTLAYHGVSVQALPKKGTVEEQRRHLFERYVQRRLEEPQAEVAHVSSQGARHWLSFLARQMRAHHQTTFYLEHLQSDWLPAGREQDRYERLATRGAGIIIGVLVSLLVTTLFSESSSFFGSWSLPDQWWYACAGGLLGGVISGKGAARFHLSGIRSLFVQHWRKVGLLSICAGGLLGGLVATGFALWGRDPNYPYTWLIYGSGLSLGGCMLTMLVVLGKQAAQHTVSSVPRPHWGHRVLPRWLPADALRLGALVGLLLGLSAGLSVGLSYAPSVWLSMGLSSGLSAGLLYGLSFGAIGAFLSLLLLGKTGTIELAERVVWSRKQIRRSLLSKHHLGESARLFLLLFLFFGLSYVLSNVLGYVLSAGLSMGPSNGRSAGLSFVLSMGLIDVLSIGLSVGLSIGSAYWLLLGLWNGLSRETLDDHLRTRPNQGILRSVHTALLVGGLTGIVCFMVSLLNQFIANFFFNGLSMGLIFGLSDGLSFGLSDGLSFGLMSYGLVLGCAGFLLAALLTGGLASLRHVLLRLQLRHLGLMPRHYVRFLDDAARRILLYKDGGGYRFIHRLFLDYFADLEAEPSRALSTAQGTGMAQEQTNGVTAAPQSS